MGGFRGGSRGESRSKDKREYERERAGGLLRMALGFNE